MRTLNNLQQPGKISHMNISSVRDMLSPYSTIILYHKLCKQSIYKILFKSEEDKIYDQLLMIYHYTCFYQLSNKKYKYFMSHLNIQYHYVASFINNFLENKEEHSSRQ